MTKIAVIISIQDGRIIITPQPGVELVLADEPAGDYVTSAEAAEILGVSLRRVTAMRQAGQFPSAKLVGRDYLLSRAEVERCRDTPRPRGRPKTSRAVN